MATLGVGPVAVIGLGVIGGSIAKALIRSGVRVRGYAAATADVHAARGAGVDVTDDIADCVAGTPVVVIAVPLSGHPAVAATVEGAAARDAVLLHTASLQVAGAVLDPADGASRVIGTHPLAGSHRAGFAAADADLLAGCVVSIEDRAPRDVRDAAEQLWRTVGARRFEYRSAEEHDRLMAWVSHLPQLASTALADAIASSGIPSEALGSGGRDATRLAASPFDMWRGILAVAAPDAAHAAAVLERSVGALRLALESGDMTTIEHMWSAARAWREPTTP